MKKLKKLKTEIFSGYKVTYNTENEYYKELMEYLNPQYKIVCGKEMTNQQIKKAAKLNEKLKTRGIEVTPGSLADECKKITEKGV